MDDIERLREITSHVHAFRVTAARSIWNCLAAAISRTPLQMAFSWQPEVSAFLQSRMRATPPPDLIHIEHFRGSKYGLKFRSQFGNSVPIVWDSVDCISQLFREAAQRAASRVSRWITRIELKPTEQYEARLVRVFDHTLVTSSRDREALLSLPTSDGPARPISVLSNGVALEYFKPDLQTKRFPNRIVMSGKMSYHANATMALQFAERVMPLVWGRRPDAELVIVGKNPPRSVRALKRLPGVEVTGTVQDLRPYLLEAALAVAPTVYGAGIQNKVLEAMACGTPVVASRQAALALNTRHGKQLLIAETPEEFAEAIVGLLNNHRFRQQIGDAGRRYVETAHTWEAAGAQLEQIYLEVANGRS